jgi:hypothetical protein
MYFLSVEVAELLEEMRVFLQLQVDLAAVEVAVEVALGKRVLQELPGKVILGVMVKLQAKAMVEAVVVAQGLPEQTELQPQAALAALV